MLVHKVTQLAERLGIPMPRLLEHTRLGLLGTINVTAPIPLTFIPKVLDQSGWSALDYIHELNGAHAWVWAEARRGEPELVVRASRGDLPDEGFSVVVSTGEFALRCVPDRRRDGLLVIGELAPRSRARARLLLGRFTDVPAGYFDTHGFCTMVASQTRLHAHVSDRELERDDGIEREFLTTARRYLEALQEHLKTSTPRAEYVLINADPQRIARPDGTPWPRAFSRPGTLVQYLLSAGGQITFAVADVSDDGDVLTLESSLSVSPLPVSGIIQVRPNIDPLKRMREALDTIAMRSSDAHGRLLAALTRPESLVELPPSDDAADVDRQARAVALALATPDLALIHGPPGTGKTTVIARIITELVKERGQRVLLVAPTHVALDNVLERVGDLQSVTAIRIGSPDNVEESAHRFLLPQRSADLSRRLIDKLGALVQDAVAGDPVVEVQREWSRRLRDDEEVGTMLLLNANLVCATPIGIAMAREFRDIDATFDVMIIDEASKATITDFLVPAARARKWILVGDHRQLAPYSDTDELAAVVATRAARAGLAALQEGWSQDVAVALRQHFDSRMHPDAERATARWRELVATFAEPFVLDDNALETAIQLGSDPQAWRKARLAGPGPEPAARTAPDALLRLGAELLEIRDLALPSVFEHLTRLPAGRSVRLNVQRRMAPQLAAFSSELVYDGDFPSAPETESLGLAIPTLESPALWIDTALTSPQQRYEYPRDSEWRGGDYINPLEVDVAQELLEVCATWATRGWRGDPRPGGRGGNAPFEIGIISFYLKQALRLRDALFERLPSGNDPWRRRWPRPAANGAAIDVHVSIVDRFQGREKDVIIVCTTRSNPEGIRGHIDNLNRLNVAVTRARHKRIVIGDSTTLSGERGGRRRAPKDLLRRLYEMSEQKKKWGRVLGGRR